MLRCLSWVLLLGGLLAFAGPTGAQSTVRAADDVYVLENARMRIEVDAAAGGRIRSWVLKPAGGDLIALWKGGREIGGALDDRAFFTAARYDATVTHTGPDVAAVKFEARHESGLSITKSIALRADSPALEIGYEFRNGSQAPHRLFIRNFFLPGAKPQNANHLYWVNADPRAGRPPVVGETGASEYYAPGAPACAALWDKATGDGILAFAPGAESFYFWRGSAEFPTFEWLYRGLPPGQVLRANVALIVVSQPEAPDWKALVQRYASDIEPASLSSLEGWTDEAGRLGVTAAERERGYWLSIGGGTGKRRLTDDVSLDLPTDADRFLFISINPLKDFAARVRVLIPTRWQGNVTALWETSGANRRELAPVPGQPVTFATGAPANLWLRVTSAGAATGVHRIPVLLEIGGSTTRISLRLRVWPVQVTAVRPFHVRAYSGGFPVWTGGYEVTERGLRLLDRILTAYADIGGDVLEWECAWHQIIPHVRIAGTGEDLAEAARTAPPRIDPANLPQLDFSYFDPWFDLAQRHGVTQIETYMSPMSDDRWQWVLLDPAVGKGRVKAGTPEAEAVIAWFYREMKRYFEAKGSRGFFCKILDEISPEHIPAYIETARVAREAGWRPYTTITGIVARSADDITAMNPYCDQWQLSFSLKDDFLALRRSGQIHLDPDDETWCYGGGSHPYGQSYDSGWVYPQMALQQGFRGYGLWAFYHWNETERILWPDADLGRVTVSPVYCGYRDGWRDALLFGQVTIACGRREYEQIIGESAAAALRVGPQAVEVYRFHTILNADDPVAVNEARRRALEALAGADQNPR